MPSTADNCAGVCLRWMVSVVDQRMLLVVVACCACAMTALIQGVCSAVVNSPIFPSVRAPLSNLGGERRTRDGVLVGDFELLGFTGS